MMQKDTDLNKVMKTLKEHYGWSNIEVLPESYVDLVNDVIKATKRVNLISSSPVVISSVCDHFWIDAITPHYYECTKCGKITNDYEQTDL